MRWIGNWIGALFSLGLLAGAAYLLGLDDLVRASIDAGTLADWVLGVLAFVWLLALLKAPWDLYFQAQGVAFEQQRARERGIGLAPGREGFVLGARRWLLRLAIALHLFSAAFAAGVAHFSHGAVGYYFAVFYLVSTLFRPALAGYGYLRARLAALREETECPREDAVELRQRVEFLEDRQKQLTAALDDLRREGGESAAATAAELAELRQRQGALAREFEATVARLTDNQDVLRGIQAFVRLIGSTAAEPGHAAGA